MRNLDNARKAEGGEEERIEEVAVLGKEMMLKREFLFPLPRVGSRSNLLNYICMIMIERCLRSIRKRFC